MLLDMMAMATVNHVNHEESNSVRIFFILKDSYKNIIGYITVKESVKQTVEFKNGVACIR